MAMATTEAEGQGDSVQISGGEGRMLVSKAPRLLFLGGGKISEALLSGLHASHSPSMTSSKHISVVDVSADRCDYLKKKFLTTNTVDVFSDLMHVPIQAFATPESSGVIVLAVKPKDAAFAFKSVKKWMATADPAASLIARRNSMILSVVAGLPVKKIQELADVPAVIRSMPNTPAAIGAGITMWCASEQCNADHLAYAKNLLSTVGKEIFTIDEDQLDMATAVSGSGPAYVYLVQESMIDAAVHMGLPRSIATELVLETLRGSVEYSIKSGKHAAVLREEITSPGGTTISALYHAEKGGLRTVLSDAMWAAYKRARELTDLAKMTKN